MCPVMTCSWESPSFSYIANEWLFYYEENCQLERAKRERKKKKRCFRRHFEYKLRYATLEIRSGHSEKCFSFITGPFPRKQLLIFCFVLLQHRWWCYFTRAPPPTISAFVTKPEPFVSRGPLYIFLERSLRVDRE